MANAMAIAGATRTAGGYATFSAHPEFPEFHDSDDYSRVIALRDSDSAAHVIVARGAHADLVALHNERSRLTHERKTAADAVAELEELFAPAEVPADDVDYMQARAEVARIDATLADLVKTRAVPTLHVARALAHYADSDDDE